MAGIPIPAFTWMRRFLKAEQWGGLKVGFIPPRSSDRQRRLGTEMVVGIAKAQCSSTGLASLDQNRAEGFAWRVWKSCGWLGDFRGHLKINDFVSGKQNVLWGRLGTTALCPRLQNLPGPSSAYRNHPGLKWR